MWAIFLETELDSPTQAAEDLVQFLTSDIGNDLSGIMFKIIDWTRIVSINKLLQFSPKVKIWWRQVW